MHGSVVCHRLTRLGGDARVSVLGESMKGRDPASALIVGSPRDGCLVRIHSRCSYSEVYGSLDCDCGGQLLRSLELIQRAGAGVLLYLDQEGRGSGLLTKARGYQYTETHGGDSYAAYKALGVPSDSRSYE